MLRQQLPLSLKILIARFFSSILMHALYFQSRSVVLFLTHTQALMLEKHHSAIADPSNEPRRQDRKYRWVWSSTNQLRYTLCKGHSSFSHGLEIPYAWKNRNLSAEYACAFKKTKETEQVLRHFLCI